MGSLNAETAFNTGLSRARTLHSTYGPNTQIQQGWTEKLTHNLVVNYKGTAFEKFTQLGYSYGRQYLTEFDDETAYGDIAWLVHTWLTRMVIFEPTIHYSNVEPFLNEISQKAQNQLKDVFGSAQTVSAKKFTTVLTKIVEMDLHNFDNVIEELTYDSVNMTSLIFHNMTVPAQDIFLDRIIIEMTTGTTPIQPQSLSSQQLNNFNSYLMEVKGLDPIGSSELMTDLFNFTRIHLNNGNLYNPEVIWETFWESDYSKTYK